jgi:hypothetical protein
MNTTLSFLSTNLSLIPGFNNIINNDLDEINILKLNKVECKTSSQKYKVIRYDKNMLTVDLIPTYGLCRSIILNCDNQVVCFAPPKSISAESFIKQYPTKSDHLVAEEFIDGTMINVFWDPNIGSSGGWELATRNTVGATSSFYKNTTSKTFRTMFLEAARENNLLWEKLDPFFCYSFVLQHPENRIVVPFKKPQLYLVAMYNIDSRDKNSIKVNWLNTTDIKNMEWHKKKTELANTSIKFPETYSWESYTELINKYANMNTPYNILGVVIYNISTGARMKIRNPVYEQVRNLRGNQPKLQYQYLCLRKEGKVAEYLKYYPESKKDFTCFRDDLHLFTNTLFSNYLSCYVKKEKPLLEFSEQFRTHMFNIHQKYINDLKEKKLFVTNTVVINYVNQLHSSLLMYCLNYQMRKRNIDSVIAETDL